MGQSLDQGDFANDQTINIEKKHLSDPEFKWLFKTYIRQKRELHEPSLSIERLAEKAIVSDKTVKRYESLNSDSNFRIDNCRKLLKALSETEQSFWQWVKSCHPDKFALFFDVREKSSPEPSEESEHPVSRENECAQNLGEDKLSSVVRSSRTFYIAASTLAVGILALLLIVLIALPDEDKILQQASLLQETEPERAMALYKQVLSKKPFNLEAINDLSWLEIVHGRADSARIRLESVVNTEAFQNLTNEQKLTVLKNLIWAELESGHNKKAEVSLAQLQQFSVGVKPNRHAYYKNCLTAMLLQNLNINYQREATVCEQFHYGEAKPFLERAWYGWVVEQE